MQFYDMSYEDLKLSLLSGSAIELDTLKIAPYTLKKIVQYGYSRYRENLQWILFSVDDFIDFTKDDEKKSFLIGSREHLKTFDFFVKLGGEELRERLVEALSMVFETDDVVFLEDSVIALDFVKMGVLTEGPLGDHEVNNEKLDSLKSSEVKLIHRDNFDDIVQIVKLQNYLEQPDKEDVEELSEDEEVRKLQEHMKKMREEVEIKKRKQSNDDGDEISIPDIISAVSSKSNSINKLNIWEFTIYQLYDEYSRLELIDSYNFGIKAMMAGAEDVDLKHWSSEL